MTGTGSGKRFVTHLANALGSLFHEALAFPCGVFNECGQPLEAGDVHNVQNAKGRIAWPSASDGGLKDGVRRWRVIDSDRTFIEPVSCLWCGLRFAAPSSASHRWMWRGCDQRHGMGCSNSRRKLPLAKTIHIGSGSGGRPLRGGRHDQETKKWLSGAFQQRAELGWSLSNARRGEEASSASRVLQTARPKMNRSGR